MDWKWLNITRNSRFNMDQICTEWSKTMLKRDQNWFKSVFWTHLNVFVNSNQCFFQSVEARGVQHLLFDASGIWAPRHEEQFLFLGNFRRSLALVFIFKIVQTIATFAFSAFHQIRQKLVIRSVTIANAFHFDHFFLFNEKNHIAMFFAFLNFVELVLAFLSYSHTRCLKGC